MLVKCFKTLKSKALQDCSGVGQSRTKQCILSPFPCLHAAQQRQRGRLIWIWISRGGLAQPTQDATLSFWGVLFSIPWNAPLSLWKAFGEVNWEAKDFAQPRWVMELEKAEMERARRSSGALPRAHATGIPVSYSPTLNPVWLEIFQRRGLLTPTLLIRHVRQK